MIVQVFIKRFEDSFPFYCVMHSDCMYMRELAFECEKQRTGARLVSTKQVMVDNVIREAQLWFLLEGRCVKQYIEHDKIMSDIYTDVEKIEYVDYNNKVCIKHVREAEFGNNYIPFGCEHIFADEIKELYNVDATEEVIKIYNEQKLAHKKELQERAKKEEEERILKQKEEEIRQSLLPEVGFEVKVIKGRKVKIGTIGTVFWIGPNKYGTSCGITTKDGQKVFVNADNVQKVIPSTPLPSLIGTDKQINWALTIRSKLVVKNPNDDRLQNTSAKYWIDNKDSL